MSMFSPVSLKHAPWSMSKAEAALRCSHRFKLKYVERNRGTEPPDQTATRIGKAAHAALEDALLKKSDLKTALQRSSLRHDLTSVEMDELFAMAHNISEFLRKLDEFKTKHDVTEQAVEVKFALNSDLVPTDYWDHNKDSRVMFRGVWDLCLRAQGKYLIIIDHKSGAIRDIATHADQLKMYAIAGLHVFPNIIGVQAGLNYLQSDEGVNWEKLRSAERIKQELLPWFVKFIEDAAASAETDIPKSGWWCPYCEYTKTCPLKQR